MKFKSLIIDDVAARQKVMREHSLRETVLYSEEFETNQKENFEYVIGLPLAVREYNQEHVGEVARIIKHTFKQVIKDEGFALAIHNKNEDDEVHFHLSYNGMKLNDELVKTAFENIEI